MGWTVFYMVVILKIPIVAAFAIIWWAVREQPAPAAEDDSRGDGGGDHPRPSRPTAPRRGPHAESGSAPPPRVRSGRRRADRVHR